MRTQIRMYGPMPAPLPPLEPADLPTNPDLEMPFGKHKGELLSTIPTEYLRGISRTHSHRVRVHEGLADAIAAWTRYPNRQPEATTWKSGRDSAQVRSSTREQLPLGLATKKLAPKP